MDQDLVDLCTEFVSMHPMSEDFDWQELFESAGDDGLAIFFQKLYGLYQP